jgi:hypothetical protein
MKPFSKNRWAVLIALCAIAGAAIAEPSAGPAVQCTEGDGFVDVSEGGVPILRYSHGATTVPKGTGEEFARGDYVSALYGLKGELLTEDYPKDHPHHRAVNWSWATVQWKSEVRDLFAVRGIWSRPLDRPQVGTEAASCIITAASVWKWDDKTPVVAEAVRIRAHPRNDQGRAIDFDIKLAALVEGLEFCGRLDAGYSGFNIRMAPAEGQKIVFHTDPAEARPRRAWADYSAEFSGAKGRSGLAILQPADNPGCPQEWREYPQLNFFQPVYPGGKLVPMPKDKPIVLHYRLWIHPGGANDKALAAQWNLYNNMAR